MTPGPHAGEPRRDGAGRLVVRIARDILMVAGAAGFAQLLAFAAAPAMTRLFAPDDFGRFALFGAGVTIIYPLVTLRYEWALPLPEDEQSALDLFGLCIALAAGFTALLAALVWFIGPLLSGWIGLRMAEVWLLPLAVGTFSLNGIATNWLGRQRAFGTLARVRFASAAGMVAAQLFLGWLLSGGPIGLMLGFVAGQVAGMLTAAGFLGSALARSLERLSVTRLRRIAGEYRSFAAITAPSNVINALGSQLPNLAFPALYGAGVAGQYALAQRVLAQPTVLVGNACNQVFWGNAPRLLADDPMRLRSLFLGLGGALFVAMLPTFALIWLGADMFAFVFGAAWHQAGVFAGLLVVSSAFQLAAQGTTSLHVYRLNHWMGGWEILQLALVAGALAAAAGAHLSPTGCVAALSLALVASNAALFALNAVALRRAGALRNATSA